MSGAIPRTPRRPLPRIADCAAGCGARVTATSRSGLCRACWGRRQLAAMREDPEIAAKMDAARRDPEIAARRSAEAARTRRRRRLPVEGDAPRVAMPAVPMGAVVDAVAEAAGLSRVALLSGSRAQEVAHPRQAAMALAIELGPRSLAAVARYFGFDRSTVRRGIDSLARRIEGGAAEEARLKARAAALAREIAARRTREATRLAAALSGEAAAGAARPASASRGSASPAKRVSAPAEVTA